MNKTKYWLGGMAIGMAAAGGAQALPLQISSSTVTNVDAPATVTVGNTQFTNWGIVGYARISAGTVDAFGESLGSASSLQITNWVGNGSGGYTGTINMLPDRGYNSTSNPTFTQQYSNYAARINTIDFSFTPYTGSGPAPTTLTLAYNGATSTQFKYNGVATTGLDPINGAAGLGTTLPIITSGPTAGKLTVDAEGLVLKSDGSGWIGDEYGPNIYHFNSSKAIDSVITPPAALQPHAPSGTLNFNSTGSPAQLDPVNGRVPNQGLEGLALNAAGTKLFALNQSGTVQDSTLSKNAKASPTRLMVYDVSGATPALSAEYVLELPVYNSNGSGAPNKTAAQSEIRVLNDHQILVLSRDTAGLGSGDTKPYMFKNAMIYDISNATNIAGTARDNEGGRVTTGALGSGTLDPAIIPATPMPAVNFVNSTQLAKFGINMNVATTGPGGLIDANTLSQKWEAMDLVSALDPANPNDYFLFVGNDNDFLTRSGLMMNENGVIAGYDAGQDTSFASGTYFDVDTQFMVFRVTIAPVPEPSTVMGFALAALAGMWAVRRRRASAAA